MSGFEFPALSFLQRAELSLVVCVLVTLVSAKALDKTAWPSTAIGLCGAAATAFFGMQDAAGGRLAMLVVAVAMAVALLLLSEAELFDPRQTPEAAALVLLGGVGALVLATGASLLELALGVELVSLAASALVALGRGERALEGAFKYFLLTALTFATLLFGMALVFLAQGTLALPAVGAIAGGLQPLALVGVAFIVVGLLFKLAVVPVHTGALDAYTAGPAGFVGFIMVASKLGAVAALGRLLEGAAAPIQLPVALLALLTMAVGVVASFPQTDLRRLLAYSAVAHAGFLALGAAAGPRGVLAATSYVVGYGLAALLAFACLSGTGLRGYPVSALGRSADAPEGLGLSRLRAMGLLLALLSLAGVPPLPGFWVKLAVLDASVRTFGLGVTATAALFGVVGIIYYLRPMPDLLLRLGGAAPASPWRASDAVVVVLAALLVLCGVMPAFSAALMG